jgi:hypothetical protein
MRNMWCFVGTLVALSLVPVQPVFAARDFSNADLRGSYGVEFEGFVTTSAGMVPAVSVGRLVGDGAGNIRNGVRTLVVAGVAIQQTFTCTYSVAPRGTGTTTCEVMTGGVLTGTEHYAFVIVEDRDEAFFIATDPGVTIGGTAKRQRSR